MSIIPVSLDWRKQGWLKELVDRAVHSVEFTKGRTNVLLKRWPLNLNAAGAQTVSIAGNFVYGIQGTDGLANVNVQFSRRDSDQDLHPVVQGLGYVHPFDKLHFSWAAQEDKTLTVLIANLAPELFAIVDNRSAIVTETLLTAIQDELRGDITGEGFGRVAVAAAAGIVVAQNANRKSLFIQHERGGVGFIYLGLDNTTAAANHFISLAPAEWWAVDDLRAAIWAIRSGAATNLAYLEA